MSSVGGIGGGSGFSGAGGIREIMALRQQIIDKSQLLQQVHAPQTSGAADAGAANTPASSFAGALQNALSSVNTSQQTADSLSAAYDEGKTTDVAKVMLARQEASVGFETTLQVRNKLLSAYQDIMKLGV